MSDPPTPSWTARTTAWATGSPLGLAVMRITVGVVVLLLPDVYTAPAVAVDHGGQLLWGLVPVDPVAARVAQVLVLAGAVLGGLGVVPRAAFGACTVAAVYLLGIAQLRGATVHCHHVVWLAALLAVAPSEDALSLSAWWRGRPSPPPSVAHGLPVRLAAVLLGLVYLFPGLHKLAAAGLLWDPTDHLYWKLAEDPSFVPLFVPGPGLLRVGGALVVVFELAFLPMALAPRLRPLAAAAGLAFHLATAAVFAIGFASLWLCYTVLLPWDRIAPVGTGSAPAARRQVAAIAVIGALLVTGAAIPGFAGQTQGWPFACYPTFAEDPGRQMPGMAVIWVGVDGAEHDVPMTAWGPPDDAQRLWGEVWRVSGVRGPLDPGGLMRLWDRIAARDGIPAEDVAAVRFYRAVLDVTPGTGGWRRGKLLYVRAFTAP